MNKDDIIQLVEELSLRSDAVINIFIVGNIDQSNSENASINILSDCCNSNSDSNFEISV